MFAGHILDTVANQTLTGTKFVGISAPVGTDTQFVSFLRDDGQQIRLNYTISDASHPRYRPSGIQKIGEIVEEKTSKTPTFNVIGCQVVNLN